MSKGKKRNANNESIVANRRSVKIEENYDLGRAIDYRAYQIDFTKLHFDAYCVKYGKPSGLKAMDTYRRCLEYDMRKAMLDDDVPKAWLKKDICRGAIEHIICQAVCFSNIIMNPIQPDNSIVVAVYDKKEKIYRPVDKVKEVFGAIKGLTYSSLSERQCEDIYNCAARMSKEIPVRCNPHEIPCRNYLWDEITNKKIPYGEDVVLMSRGNVDYNPYASNPHIHNDDDGTDWDVDSWLLEIFDGDEELVDLFWQIAARIVRPYRKSHGIVLFSGTGHNGKGTLLELLRNLVGVGAWADVGMAEFEERFGLSALIDSQVVLRDENKMNFQFGGADRLKSAASCDVFEIERKNEKEKISIVFPGLIVECVNELPRVKDKTDAWYQRLIPVPFTKVFMQNERGYIKDDYLSRTEVLEYVKRRAIETEIREIRDTKLPKRSYELLEYYKVVNDPIRSFWQDISGDLVWDVIPRDFIYDLYVAWFSRFNKSGHAAGRNTFYDTFKGLIDNDPNWIARFGKNDRVFPPSLPMPCEPLISKYNLTFWYNPNYKGTNTSQRCTGAPVTASGFKGIVRINFSNNIK